MGVTDPKIQQGFQTSIASIVKRPRVAPSSKTVEGRLAMLEAFIRQVVALDEASFIRWYKEIENLKRSVQWTQLGSPEGNRPITAVGGGSGGGEPPTLEFKIGHYLFREDPPAGNLNIWYVTDGGQEIPCMVPFAVSPL